MPVFQARRGRLQYLAQQFKQFPCTQVSKLLGAKTLTLSAICSTAYIPSTSIVHLLPLEISFVIFAIATLIQHIYSLTVRLIFRITPKKEPKGVRSGEREFHTIGSPIPIH
jgi:hypothetical protein